MEEEEGIPPPPASEAAVDMSDDELEEPSSAASPVDRPPQRLMITKMVRSSSRCCFLLCNHGCSLDKIHASLAFLLTAVLLVPDTSSYGIVRYSNFVFSPLRSSKTSNLTPASKKSVPFTSAFRQLLDPTDLESPM